MTRIILQKIIVLAIFAALAFLPGCDEEKSDNFMLLAALLGNTDQDLSVKSISPESGATGLINNIAIIITFNRPTDGTFGTVAIYNTWETPLSYQNGVNCAMAFNANKNILTVNGTMDLYVGMLYEHIVVSGFKDAAGTMMADYDDPVYHFVTWTRISNGFMPADGETEVSVSSDIKISFSGDLGPDKGTVSLDYGSNTITYVHSVNCTIDITNGAGGGVVTVNPTADLLDATTYTNISISGFKDPYGNTVQAYTKPDYDFTTDEIN